MKRWTLDRDWGWDIYDGEGKEVFHCLRDASLAQAVVDAVNTMLESEGRLDDPGDAIRTALNLKPDPRVEDGADSLDGGFY